MLCGVSSANDVATDIIMLPVSHEFRLALTSANDCSVPETEMTMITRNVY